MLTKTTNKYNVSLSFFLFANIYTIYAIGSHLSEYLPIYFDYLNMINNEGFIMDILFKKSLLAVSITLIVQGAYA